MDKDREGKIQIPTFLLREPCWRAPYHLAQMAKSAVLLAQKDNVRIKESSLAFGYFAPYIFEAKIAVYLISVFVLAAQNKMIINEIERVYDHYSWGKLFLLSFIKIGQNLRTNNQVLGLCFYFESEFT